MLLKLFWIIIANDLARSESPFLSGEQKGHAVHFNQAGDVNLLVRKKIFRRKRARKKSIYGREQKTQQPSSNCTIKNVYLARKHWASVKY